MLQDGHKIFIGVMGSGGKRAESAAAQGEGLFNSPETAIDSTALAPPRSPDGRHNTDDFAEPAVHLRLAEQGSSTPSQTPSPLSNKPLHDYINTD
jgi:hypothetical protein